MSDVIIINENMSDSTSNTLAKDELYEALEVADSVYWGLMRQMGRLAGKKVNKLFMQGEDED